MTPVATSAQSNLHGQNGAMDPPQLQRGVKLIKADSALVLGRRNSSLHKKNRHLPQLIESMIQLGATEAMAVSLAVQIESMSLTLDQIERRGKTAWYSDSKTRAPNTHSRDHYHSGAVQTSSAVSLPTHQKQSTRSSCIIV